MEKGRDRMQNEEADLSPDSMSPSSVSPGACLDALPILISSWKAAAVFPFFPFPKFKFT